jgi:hypothetical protein
MTALGQVAEISRKAIKWGAIGLVVLMAGRVIVGGIISWYNTTFPDLPEPTIGFGILPPVSFPEKEAQSLSYRLETITGGLPVMPTQAVVLYSPPQRPNLLALERSVADAAALGFKGTAEKVNETSYRFRNTTPIPMTLTVSIYDGRFMWRADWSSNPNFLAEKNLPSREQAIKEARDLVKRVAPEAEDIFSGVAEVSYLKGAAGAFQSAIALSEADFIQVDLYRALYQDAYAFVTPEHDRGIVRVILSGNPRAGRVLQMMYAYFPINYEAVETYPLKPIDLAWQELQEGKGYVAGHESNSGDVVIRSVELAYFDSFEPQTYIQPVYVFKGDDSFVGYVQAVKDPTTAVREEN